MHSEEDAVAVCAHATALISAGRHAEARSVVEAALEADGPEPVLFLVLARAHMAEDEDDHDDEAERVFRRALDAFPDHLDLLAGYAELCLRSDALDRPGRHGRGPVLLERLRELAPDSPQLRRATASTSVLAAAASKGPSAARVQRHDAVHALATAASPRAAEKEARRQAALAPYDQRLAVLDATLTALARPGRAPLRFLIRRTPEYLFVAQLTVAVLLLARHVLGPFPLWVACAVGVLLDLPLLLLRLILRGARARGGERASGEVVMGPAPAEPALPAVPRYARRESALIGAGAVIALGAVATTSVLTYAEYTAYPRYEAVAPNTFRGMTRTDPFEALGVEVPRDPSGRVEASFTYFYTGGTGDGSNLAVVGAAGDFHDFTAAMVHDTDIILSSTAGVTRLHDTWSADAGPYGGWMQCSRYVEDITGTPKAICFWADRGSMGSVTFKASDMPHGEIAQLARLTRQSVLRPVPSDS
ncbi:tetratricopeptide repeat protein [Streptomyces vietnamensis]|uniref:tetratricopeptide repeat protein n=1 Tax=Streptomyces vietnamensis TaxID=362257 RepID=UPI003423F564